MKNTLRSWGEPKMKVRFWREAVRMKLWSLDLPSPDEAYTASLSSWERRSRECRSAIRFDWIELKSKSKSKSNGRNWIPGPFKERCHSIENAVQIRGKKYKVSAEVFLCIINNIVMDEPEHIAGTEGKSPPQIRLGLSRWGSIQGPGHHALCPCFYKYCPSLP